MSTQNQTQTSRCICHRREDAQSSTTSEQGDSTNSAGKMPKKILGASLIGLAIPTLAVCTAAVVLPAVGFTATGVAAGSLASGAQSVVYGPLTTGVFSLLQQAGATFVMPGASQILGAAGMGLAGVGLVTATGSEKCSCEDCQCDDLCSCDCRQRKRKCADK